MYVFQIKIIDPFRQLKRYKQNLNNYYVSCSDKDCNVVLNIFAVKLSRHSIKNTLARFIFYYRTRVDLHKTRNYYMRFVIYISIDVRLCHSERWNRNEQTVENTFTF